MTNAILIFLMVAATVFINEVFFTLHVTRVAQRKAWTASIYGAMVYLVSAINVLNYVEYRWIAILGAVVGGFIGTLVTMKIDDKRKKDEQVSDSSTQR